MRKILSRLGAIALIFVVMLSFTACSLFTENLDQKYSANVKVASAANSDICVSRKDLYYAYLQWGYQYANQMSETELLSYITESILDNKILEEISIRKFGALRESEELLALQNVYNSLDSAVRQSAYEALDLDDETTAESTTDSAVKYEPYTKTIFVEEIDGERVFTLNLDGYASATGTESLNPENYLYTPAMPGVATDKVARQTISKMVRNLKTIENGFTKLKAPKKNYLDLTCPYFSKDNLATSERDVLNREIERMLESNRTSILVSRLSTAYNLGFVTLEGDAGKAAWDQYLNDRVNDFDAWQAQINGATGSARTVATGIANNVEKYYLEKVRNAIKSYDYKNSSDIESDIMGGKLSDIYYIPHGVAQNLFTVSHILVGFTDEQKDLYNKITEKAEKDPSYNANAELNKLYAATKSNGKNVYDIYNEVQSALQNADSLPEKYRLFRDFIYQYNTDPGMQNPDYEYLMSVNKDKNSMIEAFTEASIDLHENHTKGAISGIVWGEYGAHIIMYTRDVADFVCTVDPSMLDIEYGESLYATMTAYGNKTRFDAIAENFTRSYANYQKYLVNDFKAEHQITITTSTFKDFI